MAKPHLTQEMFKRPSEAVVDAWMDETRGISADEWIALTRDEITKASITELMAELNSPE